MMKKNDFERVVPPTPDSFHEMIERTLRQTEEESYMKHRTVRPAIALIAALITMSLLGGALAVGSHLGLWEFAKSFTGRSTPSDAAPESTWLGQTVSDEYSIYTLLEAYYEGDTITVLSELANADGTPFTESGFLFLPTFRLEDGAEPNQTTERQIADGVCLFYTTIIVPEGSPDTLTLHAEGPVQEVCSLTVNRTEGAQVNSGIQADHMTIDGAGITFTGFQLERTSLHHTLTLDYAFDTAAITAPELPSYYLDYFTSDNVTYHASRDCSALSSSIRQCAYGEVAGMTPCTVDGCSPMSDEFEPIYDGLYLELIDSDGQVLPYESINQASLIQYPSTMTADGETVIQPDEPFSGTGQMVFWIDAEQLPETIGLRIYDAWTKHRWQDTITLVLPQE